MTTPTPERMRALASALAGALQGVMTENADARIRAAVTGLRAAADEVDRLRAEVAQLQSLLAESPSHRRSCPWHRTRDGFDCTCWKADAL